MRTVITFGTYDLFHIGHINLLKRASQLGDRLIVGISSDKMSFDKKQRYPIYNQDDRREIVASLKWVSDTFLEESLDLKRSYLESHDADVLVMGDDWEGKFDQFKDLVDVVYLPRTQNISTTELIQVVKLL